MNQCCVPGCTEIAGMVDLKVTYKSKPIRLKPVCGSCMNKNIMVAENPDEQKLVDEIKANTS